jgi:predicted nucleic acid-binding protein
LSLHIGTVRGARQSRGKGLILSHGNPYEILEAWRRNEFILLLSNAIISEIERVFRLPKICNKYGEWAPSLKGVGP